MKKIILLLALAFAPLCLMAQQKVAIVNSDAIIAAMPETKAAQTKLQDLNNKYTAELQNMQNEYAKKTEAFIKEKDKLSETISKTRQQELVDMQNRIQQSAGVMQEDFQKQQATLYTPIQQKIHDAIRKVADKEGITYVTEAAIMLYTGNGAIDITDKVKAELGVK